MTRRLGRLAWLPPTLTRGMLGLTLLQAGWFKIHSITPVTELLSDLDLPWPRAIGGLVGGSQLVCGGLLLLGLLTRLASAWMAAGLAIAIVVTRLDQLTRIVDLFAQQESLELVLLGWLLVAGGGPLSLDRLVARRIIASEGEPAP